MLETVREYALERLAEDPEETEIRRRHARAYAELAGQADEVRLGRDVGDWLDRAARRPREHPRRDRLRRRPTATPRPRWRCSGAGATGDARQPRRRPRAGDHRARQRRRPARAAAAHAQRRRRPCGRAGRLRGGARAVRRERRARRPGRRQRLPRARARQPRQPRALRRRRSTRRSASTSGRSSSGATSGEPAMSDIVTQNLGLAYSGAGQHERAIELLDESVVLARSTGGPRARRLGAALARPRAAARAARPGARARAAPRESRAVDRARRASRHPRVRWRRWPRWSIRARAPS